MSGASKSFVALLRGINVGGHNKVPMADLRDVCAEIGCLDVKSYIQSGNLVFDSPLEKQEIERLVEAAIKSRFGLEIPAIVRSATQWSEYLGNNPFPAESKKEPNLVMLALSKSKPAAGAAGGLRSRASQDEKIEQIGDAVWVYFRGGSARSKLSPLVLNRLVGSPVTTRNWRTVQKLGDMLVT